MVLGVLKVKFICQGPNAKRNYWTYQFFFFFPSDSFEYSFPAQQYVCLIYSDLTSLHSGRLGNVVLTF